MAPFLVPIGNRVEIVRAVICVSMLDCHLEIFLKGHGRIGVEAIDRPLGAAIIAAVNRVSISLEGKGRMG